MREREFGKMLAEARLDVCELEIGHHFPSFASREVEPDAKRAFSTDDFGRQGQPLAPRRDIGVVEPDIDLAASFLPLLERAPLNIAANVDRRREIRGRRSRNAESMTAEAIFEAELHAVEHELRRVARIVVP